MIYPYTKLKSLLSDEDKRLYIIVGNDNYLITNIVNEIKKKHREDEVVSFDAIKYDSDALSEAFFTYPFFGGRLVVIDNFNPAKLTKEQQELFDTLLNEIPSFLTVVLTNYVDGRFSINKGYQKITDDVPLSVIISAEKPVGDNATKAVAKLASNEGVSITKEAAELLLYLAGDDLFSIQNEIKKLAALSNYTKIDRVHVERITTKTTESGVFDMISALERRNIRGALATLKEMNDNREAPLMISSTLNTAFINLYRAKLFSQSKRSNNDIYPLFNYRKDDKKVSIALNRAANYSKEQLSKILDILLQLDLNLKTTSVDSSILLEQVIIEIAATRA